MKFEFEAFMQHEVTSNALHFTPRAVHLWLPERKIDGTEAVHCCSITFYLLPTPLHTPNEPQRQIT